jgi:hypothetical protein
MTSNFRDESRGTEGLAPIFLLYRLEPLLFNETWVPPGAVGCERQGVKVGKEAFEPGLLKLLRELQQRILKASFQYQVCMQGGFDSVQRNCWQSLVTFADTTNVIRVLLSGCRFGFAQSQSRRHILYRNVPICPRDWEWANPKRQPDSDMSMHL